MIVDELESPDNMGISLGYQISMIEMPTGPVALFIQFDWTLGSDSYQDGFIAEALDVTGSTWGAPEMLPYPNTPGHGAASLAARQPNQRRGVSDSDTIPMVNRIQFAYKDVNFFFPARTITIPDPDEGHFFNETALHVDGKKYKLPNPDLESLWANTSDGHATYYGHETTDAGTVNSHVKFDFK